MKTETQEYLFELSINHPEYNFIFKAHPQQHDLEELKKQYKRTNLCVVGGSSLANELIIRSELIIAFQTTSILEAMFMNKKIIYTEWDPAIEKMKDLILPFGDANGLVVAKSFEQFKILCSKFFNEDKSDFKFTEEEEKNKHEMVNKFLYKPDGNVCKRFYEEIDRLM
jgi:CDP-glycerol glycerophosphotransferase (TagB/SpsB family)